MKHLILTGLTELWPKPPADLHFAGEFAKPYSAKPFLNDYNYKVSPCIWDSLEFKRSKIIYLNLIYEELLHAVAASYEQIFKCNWPIRSWRIFIGPWILFLVHTVCDRLWILQELSSLPEEFCISLLDNSQKYPIIQDSLELVGLLNNSHSFNHRIFSSLIDGFQFFDNSKIEYAELLYNPAQINSLSIRSKIHSGEFEFSVRTLKSNILKTSYNFLAKIISKTFKDSLAPNCIFSESYLGAYDDLKLACEAKNTRAFNLRNFSLDSINKIRKHDKNTELRFDLVNAVFSSKFSFDHTILRAIKLVFSELLPLSLVENFKPDVFNELPKKYQFIRNAQVIFSANSLWYSDNASLLLAEHVAKGGKLVYGQHGGYAIPEYQPCLDHELLCSDAFLSWGWNENMLNKYTSPLVNRKIGLVKTLGLIKPSILKKRYFLFTSKVAPFCFIRGQWGKYNFRIESGTSGKLIQQTIDDCILVTTSSWKYSPKHFSVRLYSVDYGYSEEEQWKDKSPCVNLLPQNLSISEVISKHDLFIYTYNGGTGWLEIGAAGIPVCIFFDPYIAPISSTFQQHFYNLQSVGIFHPTKESLISFLCHHGDNPRQWFNSEKVQKVWSQFANDACRPISRSKLRHEISKICRNI